MFGDISVAVVNGKGAIVIVLCLFIFLFSLQVIEEYKISITSNMKVSDHTMPTHSSLRGQSTKRITPI